MLSGVPRLRSLMFDPRITFAGLAAAGLVGLTWAAQVLAQPAEKLSEDLVAWWTFDEAEGNLIPDMSSNKRTGAIQGEVRLVPGRIGNAAAFDGKSHIRVEGFKGIGGSAARTVAAWVKTSTPTGQIVQWGSDEPGRMWTVGFIRRRLGVSPRGGYLYMNQPTDDGQWHHIAVVLEEGSPANLHDHASLYLDGKPAVIHDIGLLDLWPIDTGDGMDVTIGRGWNGLIDDLRIYARALSPEEIAALYQAGLAEGQ